MSFEQPELIVDGEARILVCVPSVFKPEEIIDFASKVKKVDDGFWSIHSISDNQCEHRPGFIHCLLSKVKNT